MRLNFYFALIFAWIFFGISVILGYGLYKQTQQYEECYADLRITMKDYCIAQCKEWQKQYGETHGVCGFSTTFLKDTWNCKNILEE